MDFKVLGSLHVFLIVITSSIKDYCFHSYFNSLQNKKKRSFAYGFYLDFVFLKMYLQSKTKQALQNEKLVQQKIRDNKRTDAWKKDRAKQQGFFSNEK